MLKRAFLLSLAVFAAADSVTDCHFHDSVYFCLSDGIEGSVVPAPTASTVPQSYTSCHAHGPDTYCMDGSDEVQFLAEPTGSVSQASSTQTSSVSNSASPQALSVTDCHMHEATQFCVDGKGNEGYIVPAPSTSAPSSYTGCHSHETEVFCMDGSLEVQFVVESQESSGSSESGINCHFHAGVEHCVNSSGETVVTCERIDRDYNIPVRVGTLFAILVTSSISVFLPLFFNVVMKASLDGIVLTVFTQFGSGVIVSTALVHLITHAQLMFANNCLELKYEATATAIVMAGLFLGFLADYISTRLIVERRKVVESASDVSGEEKLPEVVIGHAHGLDGSDKASVLMLEAGIIFHSVLIGVTTVVAGDSYYITLFIVVLFHQAFEGIALGSRIFALRKEPLWTKIAMGMGYAVTTPIGMGIGIGVLNHFNGNSPSTVIAIGTLDALSGGILLWVGLIEMLAHDWLHGPLVHASLVKVGVAMVAFVAGMILMSVLGKWV